MNQAIRLHRQAPLVLLLALIAIAFLVAQTTLLHHGQTLQLLEVAKPCWVGC